MQTTLYTDVRQLTDDLLLCLSIHFPCKVLKNYLFHLTIREDSKLKMTLNECNSEIFQTDWNFTNKN